MTDETASRPAEAGPGGGRTIRIGLTGPIGCGKSTVAGWLAARGAVVVDADQVARVVTAPGHAAHDEVIALFGDPIRAADGSLDRAALARIAFADPAALAALEAIVHPAVRPLILDAVARAEADGAPAVVVEAIKLVEGGLAQLCDQVWLVDCDPARQQDRLLGRGMSSADADRRITAQAGLADRLRPPVTHVLDTSGDERATRSLVDGLLAEALRRRSG